ncbi:MAG: hypothetical protein FK733_15015 [Asgard group archaeon]|nr:hypothetical protein [Asgard group archaeon]
MGKKKSKIFVIICLMSLVILPVNNIKDTNAANSDPNFVISILIPETTARSSYWSVILEQQLAKIGIGVEEVLTLSWFEIGSRLWSYPGPYPIPTHAEGGFDILLYDQKSGLDFNVFGLYDSPSLCPNGDNFLQFAYDDMDFAVENYSDHLTTEDRLYWAKEIQAILYEYVPSIAVVYLEKLFVHDPNLVGWNPLLWYHDYQNMAEWKIPSEEVLVYAQVAPSEKFHIYNESLPLPFEAQFQWLNQIYNGMIEHQTSTDGFFGSCIAANWNTTDGMNYTIQLHPNATWADGTPLNASDIEYSFYLKGEMPIQFADLAYKYIDVTIIDEHNLKINFETKQFFHENMFPLPIIPKHIWKDIAPENHTSQAETWAITNPSKLMGAGPYYLFDFNNDTQTIHLKRNEFYNNWTGITPHFEDILFKYYPNKESALEAVSNGTVDVVDTRFSVYIDEVPENTSYTLTPSGEVQQLAINNLHPYIGTGALCPISDPESGKYIRKAISHMIPREIIANEIYDGLATPASTPWPNSALDFDESLETYVYDFNIARECIINVGYWPYIPPQITTTPPTTVSIGFSFGIIATIVASVIIIIQFKRKRR